MDKYRSLFGIGAALLLVVLNLGYLYNVTQGTQVQWARKLDQSSFSILFLVLLIGVIVFAAVKPKTADPS